MQQKKNVNNSGKWIGVGVALGAAFFALTKDPVWVGVGVALGGAMDWTYRKKKLVYFKPDKPVEDLESDTFYFLNLFWLYLPYQWLS